MGGKRWTVTGAQKGALKSVVAVGWNGMDELTRLRQENERLRKVVKAAAQLEPYLDEIFKLFPDGGTSKAELALARLGDYVNQWKLTEESPPQG